MIFYSGILFLLISNTCRIFTQIPTFFFLWQQFSHLKVLQKGFLFHVYTYIKPEKGQTF